MRGRTGQVALKLAQNLSHDHAAKVSPKMRDETFTVPGRHGNLTTTNGAFDSYILSAEFIVKDEKRLDEICAHFKGSGWLILSSEPDRKYKARIAKSD